MRRARRPFEGLLGPAIGDASQSLGALAFSATTSLVTGFTLAAVTDTLALFPGLLLLIPAAIGLRGNVFGPLGSRLSTAIHTGTFSWSWRTDSVLGQNVIGAMASSLVAAVGLAVIADLVAHLPGRSSALDSAGGEPLDLFDFVVVSVFGGTVASVVVLGITLGLAVASVRFGWDLDNVTAPLVSASGDFVTLPSLVLATLLVQRGNLTRAFAIVFALIAIGVVVLIVRSALTTTRRILLESVPVLLAAGTLSLVAGIVLERSIGRFLTFSVLLILLPGYLAAAGALGGILSSRLSTKVQLGLIQAARIPRGGARSDIRITFTLALPIFMLLATLAGTVGATGARTSPGLALLILVAVSGGLVATAFVAAIAYYGTLLVVRFGLDPDNHGIPMVSASLDVVGSLTLVGALLLWGVA
ncbi:MAG: magnesium transporter [Actinomycetota bacterium]